MDRQTQRPQTFFAYIEQLREKALNHFYRDANKPSHIFRFKAINPRVGDPTCYCRADVFDAKTGEKCESEMLVLVEKSDSQGLVYEIVQDDDLPDVLRRK
jgi:hypothetical protein